MAGLWHCFLPEVIPMPAPTLPQERPADALQRHWTLASALCCEGVLGPGGLLPHPQSLGCSAIPTYHEHHVGSGWERKKGPS